MRLAVLDRRLGGVCRGPARSLWHPHRPSPLGLAERAGAAHWLAADAGVVGFTGIRVGNICRNMWITSRCTYRAGIGLFTSSVLKANEVLSITVNNLEAAGAALYSKLPFFCRPCWASAIWILPISSRMTTWCVSGGLLVGWLFIAWTTLTGAQRSALLRRAGHPVRAGARRLAKRDRPAQAAAQAA